MTKMTLQTFLKYAADAPNWSGTPWVSGNFQCTKQMRGNLSDLVKKGFIYVEDYEGSGRSRDMYVTFTVTGRELALQHGIDLSEFYPIKD